MISEKISLKFDIKKLVMHLENYVFSLDAVRLSNSFGGWAIQSTNGSHKDGWPKEMLYHSIFDDYKDFHDNFKNSKGPRLSEHVIPTEICHGYLNEVINQLTNCHLNPHKARIIRLSAHSSSIWHRDAPSDFYRVRLHIPIITNKYCFFETEAETEHLEATGNGYLLFVNQIHRVVNWGSTDRYHLVIDVKDIQNFSKYHRFDEFLKNKY